MSARSRSVDPDIDDVYDPSLTPFPDQRCQECRHRADAHKWLEVPLSELAVPFEKSARRLRCSACPAGRPDCVYTAETTL